MPDKPSSFNEKELPKLPNQLAEKFNCAASVMNLLPATAINNVTIEESNAQLRTVLSFLIKNDSIPAINGTKKSNKTIIFKYDLRS